jgi:hypothetical protein
LSRHANIESTCHISNSNLAGLNLSTNQVEPNFEKGVKQKSFTTRQKKFKFILKLPLITNSYELYFKYEKKVKLKFNQPLNMASNSNPNGIPVSLTVTNSMGNPTILSSLQATQLLQKLRAMNVPGGTQTIKIQAIQTNPVTGVKQIVAIPIQSATGGNKGGSGSPMKIIKLPASSMGGGGEGPRVTSGNGMPPGVKVVKLAPSPMATTSSNQNFYQFKATQVRSH